MANPVLTRGFEKQQQGPIVDAGDRMTLGGVGRSTFILFALFIPAAIWGWTQVSLENFPTWTIGAIVFGFIAVIAGALRPQWTPVIGPIYAVVEGALVGVISNVYQNLYGEGIVTNAIMATFVTVMVMVILYMTRTIRVTDRMRSVVVGATAAIFVFYLATFALSFLGVNMPLVWDSGPFGILFSLAVIALAAFNLLLDFDLIERGVAAGAPKWMDWYAGFGLIVTIVWLYLEILRLLGKLQRR
ncbi:MAG: Bax inhibitor-1/YccA family protein [Acidimicrobiia bacterium]|nr:Bax inhibitor-1/YccA family protein [Acidimicrobiia bacterium]MDX2467826.1 Bax inhibitor-1/YccA family protein [Acidimicrobiia bacterium]